MRKLLISLLFLSGSISAHPHETGLIAIIATFESIVEIPDPCQGVHDGFNENGDKTVCISMDELYKATYTVREVVSGNVALRSSISFTIADHYGFPDFARYKTALLFIQLNEGDHYLEKYQGFQIHETALAQWATCGYPRGAEKDDGELESVTFDSQVSFGGIGEFNQYVISKEFQSPVFEIRDGIVRCVRGWRFERLLRYVKEGVLAARGEKIG